MAESTFDIRGVVEGFYGRPWTHEQRKRGIEKFAQWGFNTYLIAPKDDSPQRFDWRKPLDSERAGQLRELIEAGNTRGLSVTMAVSPGLSVTYSSLGDRNDVLHRFRQQLEMGADLFVLLWDDIDWDLTQEADQEVYQFVEDAQAEFSNWIFDQLRDLLPTARLMVCPMIYCGRGHNAYLARLGERLDQGIDLMWTGREVRSNYLDVVDAEVFAEDAKRPPLYWDNFPVNNLSMRFELHMGPVVGREAGLCRASRGLLANPMNQFECSLLPLATVARFLNSPFTYQAEDAWEEAFGELFGDSEDGKALKVLLRSVMSSPLSSDAAPDARVAVHKWTSLRKSGRDQDAAMVLHDLASQILAAAERISSDRFAFPRVAVEVSEWIPKFVNSAYVLQAMAEFALSPTQVTSKLLCDRISALDSDRHIVFGDLLDGAAAELLAQQASSPPVS